MGKGSGGIGSPLNGFRSDITENMIYLHLKLSDSIWHIEQVHNLVKKTINPKGYEKNKTQEHEF